MSDQRTIVLWPSVETHPRRFEAETELPQPLGWYVVARLARCPNECVGGQVWGGDDLATCYVCDGASLLPVGIGGALLTRSVKVQIPEEPTEFFYLNELQHFTSGVDSDPTAKCSTPIADERDIGPGST